MSAVRRGCLTGLAALVVVPVAGGLAAAVGFFAAWTLLDAGPPDPGALPDPAERPFSISRDELDAMLDAAAASTPDDLPPPAVVEEPVAAPPAAPEGGTAPDGGAAPEAGAPTEAGEAPEANDAPDADDEASPDPAAAFVDVLMAIRASERLDRDLLDRLSCEQLAWAHDSVAARHGWPFTSPDARAWFAGKPGYAPQPDLSADELEAALSPEDRFNRTRVQRALKDGGCGCAGVERGTCWP